MELSWMLGIALIGLIISFIAPSFRDIILFARIRGRRREIQISVKAIGPYINTAISVFSLYIALIAYQDSAKSGPQQQAILEKTKIAVDSSTAALQSVLSTSRNLLEISNRQLAVQESEWTNQQDRLARQPKFEINYKFQFYDTQLTGFPKIDSIILNPKDKDQIRVIGSNDGYYEARKKKSPFYDEQKDQYKFVGSSEGFIHSSELLSESKKAYPILISTTRKAEKDTRYFLLSLFIKNVGDLNSEDLYITVSSLRKGLSVSGEGINAPELMMELDGNLAYSQGIKQIPLLTIYQATKEQVKLTLKVNFRDGLIGEEMPIQIGVYDKYVKNVSKMIRFKIIPN